MATLGAGSRLGTYEILEPLGHGGMGEVYRARDVRLNRVVAIKTLPALFAADPDRRSRFEREAQMLASLNHPHIAAVYGFEEFEGVVTLVMELVDGPTLADRIAASAIPVEESILIARQIAEALEAAHEKGIIHRDLKPANIKLAADGRVKVLDFGLAKALDPAGSGPSLSMSPTLTTPAMTAIGALMGTAAYMSPEQARGVVVDKRADIWAFGVVVYEMLVGGQLFEGQTVSDTLASVLRQDVDWSALPPASPGWLVQLLRRCLERDPKRRLRDIGEARVSLEPGTSAPAAVSAPAADSAPPRGRGSWRVAHGIIAVLCLALVALSIALWRATRAPALPAIRAAAELPPGFAFDLLNRPVLDVSRDGSKIVLVGASKGVTQLFLRPLSEFDPRPLPGTQNATGPFFSPDGAWVGFFADGKLKKIAADGGPVITLADASDARGGVWTDRDTIVFTPDPTGGLKEVPAAGGIARAVTTTDEKNRERTHRWPSLMPDGKALLFNVGNVEHPDDYDESNIEAVRLSSGERHVVLKGGRMARYVSTGDLLFVRGKILYTVAFDAGRLETRGSLRPMIDGVSGDTTTGAAHYSVADAGTLVYVPGDPSGATRRLAWMDAQGNATSIDLPPALYADPRVSPDGRRIAVTVIDGTSSNRDIWIVNTGRGTSSRATFQGVNRTPIWSRDGQRVYYIAYNTAKNTSAVMVRTADGTGDATSMREIPGQVYLTDVSPDGSLLVATASLPSTNGQNMLYRIAIQGDRAQEPQLVPAAIGPFVVTISPDGRWLAYSATESGKSEVYVQSLASGGSRSQVSTTGGTEARWAPNGRALYYQQGDKLMMVPIEPGAAFVAGKAKVLFGGLLSVILDSGQTYQVSPGGDRFLMMRPIDEGALAPTVRLVMNWFSELRRTAAR